ERDETQPPVHGIFRAFAQLPGVSQFGVDVVTSCRRKKTLGCIGLRLSKGIIKLAQCGDEVVCYLLTASAWNSGRWVARAAGRYQCCIVRLIFAEIHQSQYVP